MKDYSEQTIQYLGARSPGMVTGITMLFGMGGAIGALVGRFGNWAMWIPLSFLVIPPVHYLCREVLRLRQRLADLESRLPR